MYPRETDFSTSTEWLPAVEIALKDAGWTLVRLRTKDFLLRVKTSSLFSNMEHDVVEQASATRPPGLAPPSAKEIDWMDYVLSWLPLIENAQKRRIVAYRMLYNYDRDRHLYSYRDLGLLFHCSHQAVKLWDDQATARLAQTLQRNSFHKERIILYATRGRGA